MTDHGDNVSTTDDDSGSDRALRSNTLLSRGDDVREVSKHGTDYLVTPVTAAKEMVLDYPELGAREFLPAESFEATAPAWSDRPVVAGHPRENVVGDPEDFTELTYGRVFNPRVEDDALQMEAWIDVEKARSLGGEAAEVVDRLNAGKQVAVSPGYGLAEVDDRSGRYNGEHYDRTQGPLSPDHLAMFPPDAHRARCDLDDGCGAPRANAVADPELQQYGRDVEHTMTDEQLDPSTVQRVLQMFDWGNGAKRANSPDGHEPEDCGCGGECDDCASERQNSSGDDPSEEDGEASGDDHDSDGDTSGSHTMNDDTINELAEQTAFDADQLQTWDEDDLDALEQTVDATPLADGGEPEDAGSVEARQNSTEDGDSQDDDLEALVRQNAEQLDDLTEAVDDLRTNYVESEYDDDIRTVVNAIDEMDEETAATMAEQNPDALASLADEHRETEERVNYGGIAGPKDRTPDVEGEDASDYPAGTRANWEQRRADTGGD